MQALTAVVLGSTGFIGHYVVEELIKDSTFTKVRLLVRKPVQPQHSKVEVVVTNFENKGRYRNDLGSGDCIFCCIGTTMSKVGGNKDAYRKIDYDIAADAAGFGSDAGFSQYLLVSSVGADTESNNFYVRLKGETEQSVSKNPFKAIHIFRPSFLMGERKEFRMAELAAKGLMKVATIFLIGKLRKYKGIEGRTVAIAMVQAVKTYSQGKNIYNYDEIKRLASRV